MRCSALVLISSSFAIQIQNWAEKFFCFQHTTICIIRLCWLLQFCIRCCDTSFVVWSLGFGIFTLYQPLAIPSCNFFTRFVQFLGLLITSLLQTSRLYPDSASCHTIHVEPSHTNKQLPVIKVGKDRAFAFKFNRSFTYLYIYYI